MADLHIPSLSGKWLTKMLINNLAFKYLLAQLNYIQTVVFQCSMTCFKTISDKSNMSPKYLTNEHLFYPSGNQIALFLVITFLVKSVPQNLCSIRYFCKFVLVKYRRTQHNGPYYMYLYTKELIKRSKLATTFT